MWGERRKGDRDRKRKREKSCLGYLRHLNNVPSFQEFYKWSPKSKQLMFRTLQKGMLHNSSGSEGASYMPCNSSVTYFPLYSCKVCEYSKFKFQDMSKSQLIWSGPQGSHLSSSHRLLNGWKLSSLWVKLLLCDISYFCRLIMETHSTLGCGALTLSNCPRKCLYMIK